MAAIAAGDGAAAAVFYRLRQFSIELLDLAREPRRCSSNFFPDMAALIRRSDAAALQSCFDYTLFPLLLLMDAAVQCRKGRSAGVMDDLEVSDSAAEGALMCLEALLGKCHLSSVDQMIMLLKKLTHGAMLSPLEASEEFRQGIICCFKAMLLQLQPCSVSSCSCKRTSMLCRAISLSISEVRSISSNLPEPNQCLLAFLKSPDASAAVGHWLSLLLQSSEYEALQGQRGSAELRKGSLLALRILIAKVGSADSLAFFLPGIVSRLGKSLYASKNIASGAAGNASSTELAIRGLTESLMIVMSDAENPYMLKTHVPGEYIINSSETTAESTLEVLRHIPSQQRRKSTNQINEENGKEHVAEIPADSRELQVKRTEKWILETASNVDKLLSATFPGLCVHSSEKVRRALVDGIGGLLANCNITLRKSKQLLLESLCVLACDDSTNVSEAAQASLDHFLLVKTILTENEVSDFLTSLIEKLPGIMLGSDDTVALMHVRKILALVFYAGPHFLLKYLLHSPVNATRLFDCIGTCIGQNSQFGGSVDRLMLSKPLSVGYLYSIAELKAASCSSDGKVNSEDTEPIRSKIFTSEESNFRSLASSGYELPHVPPWFDHTSGQRLYRPFASILRLVGLSTLLGPGNGASLAILTDILLDELRKVAAELRIKVSDKESLHQWYMQSSGQILRQATAALYMLNEMIYGLSDNSLSALLGSFVKRGVETESDGNNGLARSKTLWAKENSVDSRPFIIECIRSMQHEYMSPEIWDLPTEQNLLSEQHEMNLPLYFYHDAASIQQVMIEGIGIFGIVLSNDLARSGCVHSSLYLLLRKLICSTTSIRVASDDVLRVLSSVSGHATVGHFVVANADYIVDSLCRQLRHLDLNPQVPDVLASVLSYIGAAHDILPFLEEPMRAVSLELEVLGRHRHPQLTIPFLKAVSEIAKAAMFEAEKLPGEAESFCAEVNNKVDAIKGLKSNEKDAPELRDCLGDLQINLHESRRYRRIVGSLAQSCLQSAIPLLSSSKESACLESLTVVGNAVISIAMVEEAYKHENQTNAVIETALHLSSDDEFHDSADIPNDADENRLLPAVNKLWPFMVICVKNKKSASVVKKCTEVVSRVVELSGGDFFIRRFQTDGHVFWNMLCLSPFRRSRNMSQKDEKSIVVVHRNTLSTTEEPMAEISSQKIQLAVLNMIADISSNKRSAAALQRVLKKVSGLVVGIACSSMIGLREAAMKALAGLAWIDADLIWLLLADVHYSLNRQEAPIPPAQEFAELSNLLPPPVSSKDYLYVQYGGEGIGSDLDPSSVKSVFSRMLEVLD